MNALLSCLLLFAGLAFSNAHFSVQLSSPYFFKYFLAALPNNSTGKVWAVLVSGSEGWDNYRHQADVCHAYQILHSNGIPDENIIVMMFDDIAFYQDNPTPGVIINYPGGPDVYKGVPKDYTGNDVTVKNFINVLTGNKTAMRGIGSGKVIESGPDDLVFINFVDHGGEGVLYFPNEELLADDFIQTINSMTIKSKFSKLILYIEACHAGSMFDNLLSDTTNVFALTASDPHESSYACYYDQERGTFLGDVFSVIWMNDTEHESLPRESLHHQFEKVRTYTNTSHVEEYGDLDIGVTKLKDVLGFKMRLMRALEGSNSSSTSAVVKPQHPMDTADNIDVPLLVLKNKRNATKDPEKSRALKLEIYDLMKKRKLVDQLFHEIIVRVADNSSAHKKELRTSKYGLNLNNFPCYRNLYTTFSNNCFSFVRNPYARVHLQKLVNMCNVNWLTEEKAVADIKSACSDILGSMKPKNIM
ncbi:legumain isoform X1 [Halyomorpha halys]|uniref:legumain isoform X1 n=1 Tax=Halyomorpha halys TaxID=286706 RepID=UPI0006D51AD6|nr:legumain-like isoform X1 [Halyomorpha halys]